jgi:hypothetical protein
MFQIDMTNPENLLKLTKKGRTLMMFVSVDGNPSREETEEITKLWQSSLWNNHIQAERSDIYHLGAVHAFRPGHSQQMCSGFGHVLLNEIRVRGYRL